MEDLLTSVTFRESFVLFDFRLRIGRHGEEGGENQRPGENCFNKGFIIRFFWDRNVG